MRHSYHTEQWLPYPVETVFNFFSNPQNLPRLMPARQKARIDNITIVPPPPSPNHAQTQAAGIGSRITLSFRPLPMLPIRFKWVAEIVEFEWNRLFSDRQISGPFAYWNHCHYIQPQTTSGVDGTLVSDDLEYDWNDSLPGQLIHRFFVRGQLKRTFAFRQHETARILASEATPAELQPAV